MKSLKVLLVSLFGLASLPALAGPAGAVFCKDQGQRTLQAYDITLQVPQAHLLVFDAQNVQGARAFQLETYKVKGELVDFSEKQATVRYVRPDGQNAQALVFENGGYRVATVDTVQYINKGMLSSFRRAGRVVIDLKGEPTEQLTFEDCTYEGGYVSDWNKLWAAP